MKNKFKKITENLPMLKLSDLALLGLVFIHGMNNLIIVMYLPSEEPLKVKIGISVWLVVSNLVVYIILKKFGRVWK